MDVSGPLDVFAQANAEVGAEFYRLCVITDGPREIRSSSGVRLLADYTLTGGGAIPRIDTLLVAGGPRVFEVGYSDKLQSWLRKTAAAAHRYGSVCTGAFVLAAMGLLSGKRITTHWNCARQARTFRQTSPCRLSRSCSSRDGRVRTASRGVTARARHWRCPLCGGGSRPHHRHKGRQPTGDVLQTARRSIAFQPQRPSRLTRTICSAGGAKMGCGKPGSRLERPPSRRARGLERPPLRSDFSARGRCSARGLGGGSTSRLRTSATGKG